MSSIAAAFISIFATFFIVIFAIAILALVAAYKLFEKAGVPGWKSLIPIYNSYVLTVEIAKLDIIWFILTFAAIIPIVGPIVALIANVNIVYSTCRRFTKESDLRVIATILFGIFIFVFAFGKYDYDNGNYSRNGFFNDSTVDNIKAGFSGESSSSSGSVNFCKNCGNKVKAGEKFCDNCGSRL